MLDERIYNEHYPTILHMTKDLGIDTADDYLRQELYNTSKEVTYIREKVTEIQTSIEKNRNLEEATLLELELADTHSLLDSLLQKLAVTDQRYLCFKEYVKRHPRVIE